MIAIIYLTLLSGVRSEVSTQSNLLKPRHFNYHPYEVRQYLEETSIPPTKKGPVIFPNSPPPPRLPLIVTSRPLIEAIVRSDLVQNNSATAASLINSVTYKPYLPRVQQYQPFVPNVPYGNGNNVQFKVARGNEYDDYVQPVLPPIYKAFSDHAQQNLVKVSEKTYATTPRPQKEDDYYNDISRENQKEYDEKKNYAFSYIVKDHKTGDDFSHSQQSSGSATNGEYRVRLPDGRTQIVSYTADENGYKADVRYDTEISNDIDNHNTYNHNRNNNDYKVKEEDNDYKVKIPIEEDNNEYYNDYSSEYNDKYKVANKFAIYNPAPTKSYFSTVRPSYEEIKNLFTNIQVTPTPTYNLINDNHNEDTDKVVIIGANRYTDVRNSISKTFQNPKSYFVPDTFSTSKPILSQNFINRINKYLTFN